MRIYLPWDLEVYGTIGGPRRSDAEENQEIPSDILQEILLKLPTEDAARCRRVSRQWRSALEDLSFRKLHAESPAALSAEPQLLRLSSKPYNLSQSITTVHNVSTRKPMCSIDIPDRYGLTNACNGLLCFLDGRDDAQAPAVVLDPTTGEALALPEPPPLSNNKDRVFAFGFSPPTNEYKLFRLSFPSYSYWTWTSTPWATPAGGARTTRSSRHLARRPGEAALRSR
ncbi:hypothetical protein D1007_04868 [Hordeum vulgare]|nr:hypothetical protein D1007_04868 [Hordeum vulgare]